MNFVSTCTSTHDLQSVQAPGTAAQYSNSTLPSLTVDMIHARIPVPPFLCYHFGNKGIRQHMCSGGISNSHMHCRPQHCMTHPHDVVLAVALLCSAPRPVVASAYSPTCYLGCSPPHLAPQSLLHTSPSQITRCHPPRPHSRLQAAGCCSRAPGQPPQQRVPHSKTPSLACCGEATW